jgi:hypothetical protein
MDEPVCARRFTLAPMSKRAVGRLTEAAYQPEIEPPHACRATAGFIARSASQFPDEEFIDWHVRSKNMADPPCCAKQALAQFASLQDRSIRARRDSGRSVVCQLFPGRDKPQKMRAIAGLFL